MYITYTQQILNSIVLPKGYKIIEFSIRVDGTGYLYAMHNNKLFEKIFTHTEMKQPAEYWINLLPKIIYNYYNGWAVKKGLRKL